MTGAFYDNLAKTGLRLLTAFGKDLVITRVVNGAYNTATGALASTTTNHTVKGQAFDYEDRHIASSGGLIASGDRMVLVSPVGMSFVPDATTDSITLSGVEWKIVRVKKPVDEAVLYELQVRRG